MSSEEWTVVRKGARPSRRTPVVPHDGVMPYRVQTIGRKRPRCHRSVPEVLSGAEVTDSYIGSIKQALQGTSWWLSARLHLENARASRYPSVLHCLGIGSVVNNTNSRHQFACALLIKELLGNPSHCTITDPVMNEDDIKMAREAGFEVVAADAFTVRAPPSGACTVLFMPHCGRALNEKTLRRCSEFSYKGIVLFGNILSGYAAFPRGSSGYSSHGLIDRLIGSKALHERASLDAKLSTRELAFNDLAVTTIEDPANDVNRE